MAALGTVVAPTIDTVIPVAVASYQAIGSDLNYGSGTIVAPVPNPILVVPSSYKLAGTNNPPPFVPKLLMNVGGVATPIR